MAETVLEKAEKVLAELRERAGKLRRVHEENLELMLRDAEKLLEQGMFVMLPRKPMRLTRVFSAF